MKKLLIASMTAALTAGVWAATFQPTREGFEDWAATKDDGYWTTQTESANISVGDYNGDAYEYATAGDNVAAFGGPGSHYLKLETENGKALYRKLAAEADGIVSVGADDGYVLDTLVQFTATDEAPKPTTGTDKFILWLKSTEVDGATTYSLMATCGIIADEATSVAGSASVELDANVTAGQWARVSVKVFNLGDTENSVGTLGFVVYVDGVAVAAKSAEEYAEVIPATFGESSVVDCMTEAGKYYYNQKQVLPCLMSGDASNEGEVANFGQMLTAVGFEGTGSIDDLQIVTASAAPSFTKYDPSEVIYWEVTFDANGVTATGMPDKTTKVESGKTISAPETNPTADGYTFVGWFKDAEGKTEFDFNAAITGNVTIYAKWTKNEEPANPVAPGETVTATTEAAATKALTDAGIKAPYEMADDVKAAYAAKFTATVTGSEGSYTATWTLTTDAEDSLKADADKVLATTLESVLDDKATTVAITAQPGFYYTVLSADAVDAAEYTANGWELAEGESVTLTLPAKSGTQGFYKIGISAVAPATAE